MDIRLFEPVELKINALREEDYCLLVDAVGWQQRSRKDARLLLANALLTLAAVTAQGSVVGMARASGDGESYAHLSDIAVHPHRQGREIGSSILRLMLSELDLMSDGKVAVTLNAAPEMSGFYERFGFVVSETPNFFVRQPQCTSMEPKAAPASLSR